MHQRGVGGVIIVGDGLALSAGVIQYKRHAVPALPAAPINDLLHNGSDLRCLRQLHLGNRHHTTHTAGDIQQNQNGRVHQIVHVDRYMAAGGSLGQRLHRQADLNLIGTVAGVGIADGQYNFMRADIQTGGIDPYRNRGPFAAPQDPAGDGLEG